MFSKANFAGKLGGAITTPASSLDPSNQLVGFELILPLSMSFLANKNVFACSLTFNDHLI